MVYNLNERGTPAPAPELVKYLAKYVALKDDGEILNFDDMAKQAGGYPVLACLKADVDNLSLLFRFGMDDGSGKRDKASVSRITTLSRMLEVFFSAQMEATLAAQEYRNCYTVYSGGDDLLIIGPWNEVCHLAANVNTAFGCFTAGNPEVTMSAGITLFKPRYPVDTVVEQAERLLDKAKHHKRPETGRIRNQIACFGKVLEWDDYQMVIQHGSRLADWLRRGELSSAGVYRLREYGRMYEQATGAEGQRVNPQGWQFASLLRYDINRNGHRLSQAAREWLLKLDDGDQPLIKLIRPITTYALYSNREGRD